MAGDFGDCGGKSKLPDDAKQDCSRGDCSLHLTSTERVTLDYILEGLTNKEIAAKNGTSPRTVEFHVRNLLRKFAVPSRARLMRAILSNQR
jgi:DNA-binding CsgD family transcriptional regulator